MTDVMKNILPLTGCNEQFKDLLAKDVEIPYGRFNYPCRFQSNPDAQYLSVQLHGEIPDRGEAALPVFDRWDWGKVLGAHVLSICDPTLYRDDSLNIGWYLGDKDESAIHGVVAIAERCAESIGVTRERIIYSGCSGGGFAALQAAALAKDGKAIAINAQTDLIQCARPQISNYVKKASGCTSMKEAKRIFRNRWNAIRSIKEASDGGNTPKIVIVQNRNERNFGKHFTPFAEAFGLDLLEQQSINDNCMSIIYDGPREHEPEPAEMVKRCFIEGVPFLLDVKVVPTVPDFSTQITLESGKIQAVIQTSDGDFQFACYLFKDDVVIEKQFYSSNNTFSFNLSGPGKYKCRGYIRNEAKEIYFKYSESVQVNEQ